MTLGSDYLSLLRSRNTAAMTVFLYYCVVLSSTERGRWFLEGWSSSVARSVSPLLTEYPWVELAQWPLERITGSIHETV